MQENIHTILEYFFQWIIVMVIVMMYETLVYVLIRWNCGGGGGGAHVPLFKKLPSFIVGSIELKVISGTPNVCETIDEESSCWASLLSS